MDEQDIDPKEQDSGEIIEDVEKMMLEDDMGMESEDVEDGFSY